MNYRLNKETLLEILGSWNSFINRKIHLIACGGTALTLLNIKESTKDVDFIVPDEKEYAYLIGKLIDLSYERKTGAGWQRQGEAYIFDIFCGNTIFTTTLLESPLKEGNHEFIMRFTHLYIGTLNMYDWISSKLFRGTTVDYDDCLMLARTRKDELNLTYLESHYKELALYHEPQKTLLLNLEFFLEHLRKESIND
jgi:hypothetical protein